MSLITDAMVEAAARAEWTHEWPIRPWEKAPDDLADHYRGCSRAALEAAAPLIAAQVLGDAADAWRAIQRTDDHLLRQWLDARANSYRSQS